MFRTRKRPLALMLVMSLLLNLMPVTTANAEAARRQTVIERTLNYSKGVDLIDVRQKAASSFRGNVGVAPKVFSDEAKANAKLGDCGGFTVKRGEGCEGQNIPCCGKEECYLPCRVNGSLSHGDKNFCLEAKQFSDIYGRSCCGEEDCKFTDINYRIDVCNGYTQTSKGLPCCGKDDCSQKECNYHTETTGEYGGSGTAGLKCCGDQDCHLKECDNNVYGTKPDGTEVACCGKDDCHYRKCDGLIKVDSKVDDKKDISCCGADDCHLKECNNKISTDTVSGSVDVPCCGEKQCWAKHCDGKTVVQTKDGLEECCGQEDCDKKACGGYTSVTLNDGSTQVCCGKKDCEEKFKASLPINLVGLPFDLYTGCIGDGGVFHPHITIYGNPHKKMFINKLNTEEVMEWVNGTFPYPPLIDHSCNPSQYKYENTLLDYVYENHKLPSEYNSIDELPVSDDVKELIASYINNDGQNGRLRCQGAVAASGSGVVLDMFSLECYDDPVFNKINSFTNYGDNTAWAPSGSEYYGVSASSDRKIIWVPLNSPLP